MPSGRGSPNQTTPGRARPPHPQCGGSFGNGARRSGQLLPHDGAAHAPDITVQFQDASAAGHIVQTVDVLCDQSEVRLLNLQPHQRRMAGIRPGLLDAYPPPVVPFPNQARIARESLRRRQVLGLVLFPHAAGSAKGRDTALRGDPRSGQHATAVALRNHSRACSRLHRF